MKTKEQIKEQIQEIQSKIDFMIGYMQIKMKSQDWHGVEDAGSDIRDMEAEKKALSWVLED
jgi:TolA-binding protein